ncbi:ABC transporter ATP-binding protein [Cryptosporangium minutisporangium]|uniref:ABC transporter ATP-binding protein n=1 Tax=Cryptosporangium minutisporangium TaxID=113569 RepID=A0ABP6SW93_9ACTN
MTGAVIADLRKDSVEVALVGLRRTFGTVHALDGLDLTLAPGELVALLGPSGCGKTTALRVLAGLEDADAGSVTVGGKDVTRVPASRRNMGMVFQAYSLFPHLTAAENVEFGLRLRKVGSAERRKRAAEVLELTGLAAQSGRYPHELSGGQQQRVALARALAIRPAVLLLDEPLSALDAKVRVQLRDEIRRIQLEVGTTTLFVTHDQEEALAVADRVGVMRAGNLEQIGVPEDVYARPTTAFVAEFVGLSNRLPGEVRDGGSVEVLGQVLPLADPDVGPRGTAVTAYLRPEAVQVAADPQGSARVVATAFLGSSSRVTVRMPGDESILAQVPSSAVSELAPGTAVRVTFARTPVAATAAQLSPPAHA